MKNSNEMFDYLWRNHYEAFEYAMDSFPTGDETIFQYVETLGAHRLRLYCDTYLGEGGTGIEVYREALKMFVYKMATRGN